MHPLGLAWLAFCCATVALTSPIHPPSSPPSRRSLSIPLAKLDPRSAGVRGVYRKYGIGQGLQKRAGEVPLADLQSDIQYYGQVHVGTPPTAYNVIVDTGSADMILATAPCGSGCEPNTPIYHPSLSSTSGVSSDSFSVTYGTGSAHGVLVNDVVSFGGYKLDDQIFAACSNLSGILQGDVSGLLGLSWQPLATSKAMPFVQALWQRGLLDSPVFGFAFARWNGNSTALSQPMPGGMLTLGAVDSSLFADELNWLPLTSESSWQVELQSVSVLGAVLDLTSETVTIDTGTSLVGAPLEAVEAIYAEIPGSERYSDTFFTFPCSTDVLLSLTFGNVTYPLDSRDFNNGPVAGEGSARCLGAIFVLDDMHGQGRWIVGDAFLKNVYSAFRFDPPAVGFARLSVGDEELQQLAGPIPKSNGTRLRETNLASITPDDARGGGGAPSSGAGVRWRVGGWTLLGALGVGLWVGV